MAAPFFLRGCGGSAPAGARHPPPSGGRGQKKSPPNGRQGEGNQKGTLRTNKDRRGNHPAIREESRAAQRPIGINATGTAISSLTTREHTTPLLKARAIREANQK